MAARIIETDGSKAIVAELPLSVQAKIIAATMLSRVSDAEFRTTTVHFANVIQVALSHTDVQLALDNE